MKYIEAINDPGFNNLLKKESIFLAGGITGCPDWQQEVRKGLQGLDIIVLNPRRKNFPIHDPNAAREQITWEYDMLNRSSIVTFWFAKETIQPIVLLELGRFLNNYTKDILIGIHPEYPRRQDVEIQTKLARPRQLFVYSLEEHINQIGSFIAKEDW